MKNLFFDYPSTAKIRVKRSNVMLCPEYPCLYGVVTERLSFVVPKKMGILTDKYLYFPRSLYERVLENYYKNIKK